MSLFSNCALFLIFFYFTYIDKFEAIYFYLKFLMQIKTTVRYHYMRQDGCYPKVYKQ